jgi:hypothetical protein
MDMRPNPVEASLHAVIARMSDADRARVDAAIEPAAARATAASTHWNFDLPAQEVDAVLGEGATDDARRGLIAVWTHGLMDRARAAGLPQAVMDLYPYWIEQTASFLLGDEGDYDRDFWAKDVRFALALSVPGARSQIIDLSSPMGPGESVRHALSGRGIGPLVNYVRHGANRPWLQVHTESRHLEDFNEDGWNRAWATAAEICKVRPDLAGMIGSSWFYDPPLETISPRLAHLRLNPLNGGAWMVHQGPGEIHTQRAAASPGSRRALIESGQYVARSWLVAWPRKALIAWADNWTLSRRERA